jgi:outer membrane receptor protein involved in Fe transport
VSWQYGEKAGIAQTTNGISNLVLAEETSAFEIGVKTTLLNNNLVFNADLFSTDIENYQQGVRVLDEYTTALNIATGISPSIAYTTATGNVPKVRAEGLEVDGFYAGIPHTRVRFALAYTDASYKEFPNSAQPSENGFAGAPAYRDLSGSTLPGSSKLSGNLGVDYRHAVWSDKEIHLSANVAYSSKTNTDNALSEFGWIPGRTVTDLSVGVGRAGGSFDVGLLAKNVFDDDTPLAVTWNSFIPPEPRWLGVVITGRL